MKRILFFLLIFFCLFDMDMYAQESIRKITKYKFMFSGGESLYKREFLSDSIFVEKKHTGQFPQTDSGFVSMDTFKVVNGNWYYLLDGKFTHFFSKDVFANGVLTKVQYNKAKDKDTYYSCIGFAPFNTEVLNNRLTYVFRVNLFGCREPVTEKSYSVLFYFDPLIGFIRKKFKGFAANDIIVIEE